MPDPLTPKQQEVLDTVRSIIRKRGESPSIREIADTLGLGSPSNIHRYLVALESKGYVDLRRTSSYVEVPAQRPGRESVRLTTLQAEVYDYVVQSISQQGYAPTVREIKDEVGASIGGVYKALQAIERKGLVELFRGQQYGISLINPHPEKLFSVPVQGVPCEVSALLSPVRGGAWILSLPLGSLLPWFKEADAPFVFGAELLDGRGLRGYSKGDLFLIDKRLRPRLSDIVAVEFRGRVILRHWLPHTRGKTRLSASEKGGGEQETREGEAEDIIADTIDLQVHGAAFASIKRSIGTRRLISADK